MLRGNDINVLVDLLRRRGSLLYHSCQYIDFQSYLRLGGIPSRKKLCDEKQEYTEFETDSEDQRNAVWGKVFLNLQDFGEIFEKGNGVPTVYGPIQLLVRPEALSEADDIAVCLRSAGSPRFDRDKEALRTVQDVDRIFLYPLQTPGRKKKELKSREKLQKEFCTSYVSYPEISLSIEGCLLPLHYVETVKIDPYRFCGSYLFHHIKSKLGQVAPGLKFQFRQYQTRQRVIIDDITRVLIEGEPSFNTVVTNPDVTDETREWILHLRAKKDMEIQWRRYAHYLRHGTLLPILDEKLAQSDYGLYRCLICSKRVIGFAKNQHAAEMHNGNHSWTKIT